MNIRGQGCILLFFNACLTFSIALTAETDPAALRKGKAFSLFSVVTFKNEECTSESTWTGGVVQGTCYSTTECNDKDGTKSGNCASGFGVCCIFISNTGTATISENRTYLQSLLFPAIETSTASITYTINKMQSDICQVRLDFDYFVIAGPTNTDETGGVAATYTNCGDTLTTTLTSNAIVPVLCGVMTGSHIYLDVGMETADTASLVMAFAATTPTAANAMRSWRVKTSQIPCWASYRAPAGCHQYMYGDPFGSIWSPNFRTGPSTTTGTNAVNFKQDLMGLDLKYCIRREMGMCCTLFQVCNTDPDGATLTEAIAGGADAAEGVQGQISPGWSFSIDCGCDANCAAGGAAIDGTADSGKIDESCTGDYVEIPDSSTGVKNYGAATQVNTRYCCNRLGFVPPVTAASALSHAPVWKCTEPFEVNYHTDIYNDEVQTAMQAADAIAVGINRGMCLFYKQEAC